MAADVARLRLAVSLESLDGADLSSDGGGSDGFSSSCSSSSRGDEWVTTPGGNRHLGTSPLLGRDVVIDEEEATYVLVFTRASPGAVKNCDAMVTEPLARAREIFLQPRDQIIEGLGIENMGAAEYIKEMSVGEYHEIVRHKIEAILRRSGFVCSCFSSVDGDETFLKIHLDPDGDTVRKLAEQFKYQVPLSKSNYDSRKRITTDDGSYCFAYTPFTVDLHSQGKLQRLRRVDVIRIAHRHLSNLINLQELVHQKFITAHFPVEGFKEQRELKEKWALPLGSGPLPSQVRDYFGEKIAFFFHFFAFYVRAVCLLSVIALCFCWMDFSEVRVVDVWTKSYVRFLLAAVIVIWAIVFEISLNRSCARMAHVWGMSATTMKFVESDLPEFDKKLVGTPTAKYRGYIAHVCTILYCALFIIGVCAMKKPRVLGYFDPYKHWIITFLIVLAKWQWGKSAAPKLTRMENHKTQQRFDDALTLRLAAFKLFFTLWPPMSIFLFDKLTMAYCGPDFRAAVELAYGDLSLEGHDPSMDMQWPSGENAGEPGVLNVTTFEDLLGPYRLTRYEMAFRYMSITTALRGADEVCVAYCLPVSNCEPIQGHTAAVDCETNCHDELIAQISTQFIVHVVMTVVLLVYPLVQVRNDIGKEVRSARRNLDQSAGASPRTIHYTALQVQAKRQVHAKYEYYSFGGSFVEDFLELILGFAWISVFGMVNPTMIVIAGPILLAEYRLVQLRMLLVTGRPYPEYAAGIGSWQVVIVMVGTIAVFCNGYLAAFVMGPARSTPFKDKLLMFLCFGSSSLLLRTILRNGRPSIPRDVRCIEDYNHDVLKRLSPVEISTQFDQDGHGNRIDLGLRPRLDALAEGGDRPRQPD